MGDQLPASVERFYYCGPIWPIVLISISIAGVGLAVATMAYFRRRDK